VFIVSPASVPADVRDRGGVEDALLLQLTQQLDRTGTLSSGKGGHSASSVDSHSSEQLGELLGSTWIEPAIGALGQLGDLPKHSFDLSICPFLEHERGNAGFAQGSGIMGEIVRVLLHSVTDENQGLRFEKLALAPSVGEHLADLGMTHAAIDAFHESGEVFGLGDPAGGAAFGEAAIVDQLDAEPTDTSPSYSPKIV
jgi:hypothetical protein